MDSKINDQAIHGVCASVLHQFRLRTDKIQCEACNNNNYNNFNINNSINSNNDNNRSTCDRKRYKSRQICNKDSTEGGTSSLPQSNEQISNESFIMDGYSSKKHHVFARATRNSDNAPSHKQSRDVKIKGFPEDNRSVDVTEAKQEVADSINPLVIPSIINHIASFLSCADLKRCRLLNKQWNEECCKFLRKRGLVKLSSKSQILRFTSQFQDNPKFCENFSFEITRKIDEETNKLLDKFGPFIKSFKLDFSTTSYHLSAEDFFNVIFTKLPNLQELSLVGLISEDDHFLPKDKREIFNSISSSTRTDSNSYRNGIGSNQNNNRASTEDPSTPILPQIKSLEIFLYNSSGKNVSKHQFLIELLRCVPNMEKISVPKVPRMLSFGMPLLHTLITTEHLTFDNLRHLDMDIALYNGSIDVLKSKGYPLKYLNAEINSTVSEDSLHSLLETYGKTLVALQLKFPRSLVATSEFRSSTSFEVLRHMTLHGYRGSLKFLEQLNLQTFGLIDNSFAAAMQREDFSKPISTQFHYKMIWTSFTEEAYCFDCLNSSDAQLLRVFSTNFLNLSSLNLPQLNDNDLRIIYQTFSHSLQELSMENSLCSDFGLTGISHELCCDLSSEIDRKADEHRTQPFIGNLKRLRRLEILTPSIHMTDASITYGIVYCENLKVCIIRNAPITDFGLRKLVNSMYLEHLETTMCANIRGPAVKFALEKMTSREMSYVWNKYQSRLTVCCINRLLSGNSPVTCIVP